MTPAPVRRGGAVLPAILLLGLAGGVPRQPPTGPAPTGVIAGKISITDREGPRRDHSDVVIYLEGSFPRPEFKTPPAATATAALPGIVSQKKRFTPKVLTVQTGTLVSFPNMDKIFHNVFSVSPVNRFDLGLYKNGDTKEQAFNAPGLVRVYCNIHPQMVAYLWVFDHPYFTRAHPDGSFSLAGVPEGNWQLKVWDERAGEQQQPVAVAAGGSAAANFILNAAGFKPLPHKNKFGQEYKKASSDDDEIY